MNIGFIIMAEPCPQDQMPTVEQAVGEYPQGNRTGALLTIQSVEGSTMARVIDPAEAILCGGRYFLINTVDPKSDMIVKRIAVAVTDKEANKYREVQLSEKEGAAQKILSADGTTKGTTTTTTTKETATKETKEGTTGTVIEGTKESTAKGNTGNGTTAKGDVKKNPRVIPGEQKSVGTELYELIRDTWQGIVDSEFSSKAFLYMIYSLCFGFLVGSIHRVGWCRIPGLNPSYCNYVTAIFISGAMVILGLLAYMREPPDPKEVYDLFDYWQFYVIVVFGTLVLLSILMFSLRQSGITAYGDFGSTGMGGMPGMPPQMSGYYR